MRYEIKLRMRYEYATRLDYGYATDALRVRYGCATRGSKFQIMSFRKLAFFKVFAELLFSGHAAIRAEMEKKQLA